METKSLSSKSYDLLRELNWRIRLLENISQLGNTVVCELCKNREIRKQIEPILEEYETYLRLNYSELMFLELPGKGD